MITRHYICKNCGIIEQVCSIHDSVKTVCNCGEELKRAYNVDSTPVLWVQMNKHRQTGIQIYQEKPIL